MSRATELNFRHPREITDAIYNPDVSAQITLPISTFAYVCLSVCLGNLCWEAVDFQNIARQLREDRFTSPFPLQSCPTARVPAEWT